MNSELSEAPETGQPLGIVRLPDLFAAGRETAVKECLGGDILHETRPIVDERHANWVEVRLTHPEFELVDPNLPLPFYDAEFTVSPDGTVTRGPLVRRG